MVHRKLRVLLSISYYHMLAFGLMPAMLHITEGQVHIYKVSTGYLIYSLSVTGLSLWGIMYLTPTRLTSNYVISNIVIKWAIIVKLMIRMITAVTCYGVVWLLRRRLTQLFKEFILHWNTNWAFLRRLAGTEAVQKLQLEMAVLLQRHLSLNYCWIFSIAAVQYQLGQTNPVLQLMAITFLILSVTMRMGFVTMLVLLVHQFKAVQLALQNRCIQMGRSRSVKDLRRIADIHTECRSLARRAFSIYNLVNAANFVNMFAMNINILFHATQFVNQTIKSDSLGRFSGECLTIFNIWLSLFEINMVDDAVNSCNGTGQLLRHFSDVQHMSLEYQMELEIFRARLCNNRLVYKLCGCVVIDKPACLSYLASVLSNVIILVQFDLKLRQEAAQQI